MEIINIVGELAPVVAIIVTLATSLTQAVKIAKIVPKRYLPLVSVILGIGFAFLFVPDVAPALIIGTMSGLAASGLYDFGKKTIAGK